jgi:pimeloyl-ACP methyl ester carboxylesterase
LIEAPAFAEVRKHHDVLLLDQRGTGGSNPLSCKKAEAASDENALALDLDKVRKDVAACLEEVKRKADPRYYTTTVAVQDLEDVRQALGSPQLDLVGVSYGTRMAQQYLKAHPTSVRSVVLDSVVSNQAVLGQDFAANLDDALKQDFALCTAVAACKQRFGDSMQTLGQLRDALRANPHKVSFRDPETYETVERPLSEFSLASVVRMFAYEPETAALLPLSINAAAHGDVGPLLGQAKLLSGDLSGDMNNGMSMSVICSEDADLLQPRPQDQNTILGNHLIDAIKAQCAVWPHGTRPDDFHAPLRSDKPILMLSGELDPVTPPRYGAQILPGLSDARQLIFKGQGHSLLGRGCMPQLLAKFVDQPDPRALDAGCLDKLGATPTFIDFNGASP